jgi:gamma-glutamylcyclotransferase (GGCT)/AIG2-like uncharacterized protein YtfP
MVAPEKESRLFVYGSLLEAAFRTELLGRDVATSSATLRDYERGRGRYFFLKRQSGATTVGLLLQGLTSVDLATLDRYEELPRLYTRERISVETSTGDELRCWIYLPTPAMLTLP